MRNISRFMQSRWAYFRVMLQTAPVQEPSMPKEDFFAFDVRDGKLSGHRIVTGSEAAKVFVGEVSLDGKSQLEKLFGDFTQFTWHNTFVLIQA